MFLVMQASRCKGKLIALLLALSLKRPYALEEGGATTRLYLCQQGLSQGHLGGHAGFPDLSRNFMPIIFLSSLALMTWKRLRPHL